MTTLWVLTILMINGTVEHGKFIEKSNCEKVGKQIVGNSKSMKYVCKRKKFNMK
jgi:hypothetical protein